MFCTQALNVLKRNVWSEKVVLLVHICKLSYNLEEDNKQAKAKVKKKIVLLNHKNSENIPYCEDV